MPRSPTVRPQACRLALLLILAWIWAGLAWAEMRAEVRADARALVLATTGPPQAVWPAIEVLAESGGPWTLAQARARRHQFAPPEAPHGNLGPQRQAVWLRLVLQAPAPGTWALDIDYPALNRIQLAVLHQGEPLLEQAMGSAVPPPAGQPPRRSHGAKLVLPAAGSYELYLRVQTDSAMILPIRIGTPEALQAREHRIQLIQGVMNGVALALAVYSLAHWASLGNPLFAHYALMMLGTAGFFAVYFGIAQQHLGLQLTGPLEKAAPMAVLLGLVAGSRFVVHAMAARQFSPVAARGLDLVGLVAGAVFLAGLADAVSYRTTQLAAAGLGPVLLALSVPVAWRRARSGDRAGWYMLLGWGLYLSGAMVQFGLLRGLVAANDLSLNLLQWAWAVEMLAWLRVLGLHIEAVRHAAESAEAERRALRSLAQTDPLTGLPNRRGLQAALAQALPGSQPESALAVYLLDLDGFKPVNDRLGHDAGDRLLVQVGERLQARLRHSDLVARLGGDEFVVMAVGLGSEAEAQALGRKLLGAFDHPFDLDGQGCRVGATIGFALAPQDGREGGELLRRADAAMYAGKQAGRHTLRRGTASVGLAG